MASAAQKLYPAANIVGDILSLVMGTNTAESLFSIYSRAQNRVLIGGKSKSLSQSFNLRNRQCCQSKIFLSSQYADIFYYL